MPLLTPPERSAAPLMLFERALLQFYQQVDRCRFNRGHLNCLRTIRRQSFDLGRPVTDEIGLDFFVEDNCFKASAFDGSVKGSKFDKADASRRIDDLERMRVVVAPVSRRGSYGINVLWTGWRVTLKSESERLSQGLFDLAPDDLANQLRKDFVELGGCPPIVPQGRELAPIARSMPGVAVGDCNADGSAQNGDAAGVEGSGGAREVAPACSTLPIKGNDAMGDSPHAEAPGVRSVGKIPTADSPGVWSVGKIPTR